MSDIPSNTYGEVEIQAEGGMERNVAKYIRLSTTSDLGKVSSLLTERWNIHHPRLLISVTGEGVGIITDPSKRRKITSALQIIAREKGIWFVTDGADSEIAGVIGNVVENENVNTRPTIIGITTWQFLRGREVLDLEKDISKTVVYKTWEAKSTRVDGDYCLNPFCTHFLLMDKGARDGDRQPVSTAQFRTNVEEYMTKIRDKLQDGYPEVPSLLLVAGGENLQSSSMIKRSLDLNRPVVILQGSGGFADFLARIVNTNITDAKSILGSIEIFNETERGIESMIARRIEDLLKHKNWSSVEFVDLLSEDCKLDASMLDALASKSKDQRQLLQLTFLFNSVTKAKQYVFSKARLSDIGEDFAYEMMTLAIRNGNTEFVRLLIKECVSIEEYLNKHHEDLYIYDDKTDNELDKILHQWFQDAKKKTNSRVETVRRFIVGRIGLDIFSAREENKTTYDFDDPYFDLLICCVIHHHRDLAKFAWQFCKEPISSALIASGVLRKIRKGLVDVNRLLSKQIFATEVEFSNLAKDVLNQCFEEDPRQAEKMLCMKRARWRGNTCLDLAYMLKNKPFISSEACKRPLKRLWMNDISEDNGALRFILSPIILGPFILKYRKERTRDEGYNGDKTSEAPGCCSACTSSCAKFWRRVKCFYTAPVMKFTHRMTSYLVFLALFAYALLTGFKASPTIVEYILYIWVSTIAMEEIFETLYLKYRTNHNFGPRYADLRRNAISLYVNDRWNYFDLITILFFATGAAFNYTDIYGLTEAARVLLVISFLAFCMRILKVFSALEELGPKILMIAAMAKDMMYFLIIMLVFIIAYAIANYSLLYPQSDFSLDLVLNVLRLGYWNMYAELLLEDLEIKQPSCTFDYALYSNGTLPRCPVEHRRQMALVMMGIYLLFSNILLLNILIAMFADTYRRIHDMKDSNWNYQNYALIREFKTAPVIPVPILSYLAFLVQVIHKTKKLAAVENVIQKEKRRILLNFEREMTYVLTKKMGDEEKKTIASLTEKDLSKLVAAAVDKRLKGHLSSQLSSQLSHQE